MTKRNSTAIRLTDEWVSLNDSLKGRVKKTHLFVNQTTLTDYDARFNSQ